jgi:hypothetical protein
MAVFFKDQLILFSRCRISCKLNDLYSSIDADNYTPTRRELDEPKVFSIAFPPSGIFYIPALYAYGVHRCTREKRGFSQREEALVLDVSEFNSRGKRNSVGRPSRIPRFRQRCRVSFAREDTLARARSPRGTS